MEDDETYRGQLLTDLPQKRVQLEQKVQIIMNLNQA